MNLQSEHSKTQELESYIEELSKTDASSLQLENSLLQSRIHGLEKDYEEIKSKLFTDFSGKESHIVSLAESKQLLEEELKTYQEISLTKNKQSAQKFNELEARVTELVKINQELEEKLQTHLEKNDDEIENLRESLNYTQELLATKKKENIRLMEKLETEKEDNERLREHIYVIEEKVKIVETENDELMEDISNRERKIKSLTSDIDVINEDLIDKQSESFDNLAKEMKSLNSQLKNSKDQYSALLKIKEDIEDQCDKIRLDSARKVEILEKERKTLGEQVALHKSKYEALDKSRIDKEESIRASKDEVIQELQQRILILKQEKNELDSTLQELQDQIQVNRISAGIEIPLSDELSMLRESYNSRCSTPRQLTHELKKFDKSPIDYSEKELQIQVLKTENLNLKHQIENIVPSLLMKLPEYQTLAAEKKRLETELVLAKECWGNENNSLRVLLEETEAIAINANLRYAEAATDRDLYQKITDGILLIP